MLNLYELDQWMRNNAIERLEFDAACLSTPRRKAIVVIAIRGETEVELHIQPDTMAASPATDCDLTDFILDGLVAELNRVHDRP